MKIALVAAAISYIGCDKELKTARTIVTPPPSPMGNSFLALGDSYTVGQSVAPDSSFPAQTKKWLELNGVTMSDMTIIAATGWTSFDLANAINSRNPAPNYSAVSLLIGVNDQYSRRDTTGYRTAFTNLLKKAIQLAANRRERVFVISIPDYSVTPYAGYSDTAMIRKQIDWFNNINYEVTLQQSCKYLDITPSTREARYDLSLIANDGLHPSGKEYLKWAQRLAPMMKAVLN